MAKFCEFRDLFKWNKQLMEDDYNDGQAYFLKTVHKGSDAEFTHTVKVAEPKSEAHKVSLEHKTKWVTKEMGGMDTEFKLKNNGEIAADMKSDYLKQFEGLENVRLLCKGTMNTNGTPLSVGASYLSDSLKGDLMVDTSKDYGMVINYTHQLAPWLIMGVNKKWKSALDPMNNVKWACGFTGHFEKSLQWGLGLNGKSETLEKTALTDATLYFNYAGSNQTVGAEMKYDQTKKAFASKLGLALKQDDHTWKFRLHDSGLARAALQWQLHKVCKTTLDTSVDIKSALNGSVTSLPVGLSFELKY